MWGLDTTRREGRGRGRVLRPGEYRGGQTQTEVFAEWVAEWGGRARQMCPFGECFIECQFFEQCSETAAVST